MKVSVVGNSCGGKTRLSQRLGQIHSVAVTHVDSIQFLPGMGIRPHDETIQELRQVQRGKCWIIDGYGPLDILVERFRASDVIVFIDLPLARHLWWLTCRQFKNIWTRRPELPTNCNELSWKHTLKLYRSLLKSHRLMRPELLRIFARAEFSPKMHFIHCLREWNDLYESGSLPIESAP